MKKRVLIIGICCLCLVLAACEPIMNIYEYDDFSNHAVDVELIYYNNPRARTIRDLLGNARHSNFNFNKMKKIKMMKEEKHTDFYKFMSDEIIFNHVSHKNSPNGICIKVNHSNGGFDIISPSYIGRFDSKGKSVKFMGTIDSSVTNTQLIQIIEDHEGIYFEIRVE